MNPSEIPSPASQPESNTPSCSGQRENTGWLSVCIALTIVAVAVILVVGHPHATHGRFFGFYGHGRGGGFFLAFLIAVLIGSAGVWLVHCLVSSDDSQGSSASKS